MIAAFGKWLITSRWGQTLLLAAAISLTAFLVHWYVDAKAYARGKTDCTNEHNAAVNQANQKQAAKEQEQREGASEIEKKTDAVVAETVTEIAVESNETKEIIRDAYREPQPAVPSVCVPQPLDPRVQQRIDRAVDSSNSP